MSGSTFMLKMFLAVKHLKEIYLQNIPKKQHQKHRFYFVYSN